MSPGVALIHRGNTQNPPNLHCAEVSWLAEDVFWEIVKQCSATKSTNLSAALKKHGHMTYGCLMLSVVVTTFDLSLRLLLTSTHFLCKSSSLARLRSPKGVCFYLVFPGTNLVNGTHVMISYDIADRHWIHKQRPIRPVYQHVFSMPFQLIILNEHI